MALRALEEGLAFASRDPSHDDTNDPMIEEEAAADRHGRLAERTVNARDATLKAQAKNVKKLDKAVLELDRLNQLEHDLSVGPDSLISRCVGCFVTFEVMRA